jgi:hypothetical protein
MPRIRPHATPTLNAEFDNVYADIQALRLTGEDRENAREVETVKVVSFAYPIELNHAASTVWREYDFGLATPHGPAYTVIEAGMAWLSASVEGLDYSNFSARLMHKEGAADYWVSPPPVEKVFCLFGYTQALGKYAAPFHELGKPINAVDGDQIFLRVMISRNVDVRWRTFCYGTYMQHDGVGLADVS